MTGMIFFNKIWGISFWLREDFYILFGELICIDKYFEPIFFADNT